MYCWVKQRFNVTKTVCLCSSLLNPPFITLLLQNIVNEEKLRVNDKNVRNKRTRLIHRPKSLPKHPKCITLVTASFNLTLVLSRINIYYWSVVVFKQMHNNVTVIMFILPIQFPDPLMIQLLDKNANHYRLRHDQPQALHQPPCAKPR